MGRPALAAVASLALYAGLAGPAPGGEAPFDDVRDGIRRDLVRRSIPSVAVAVSRGDHVLWEEGFGWADRENRVPATEHTPYTLGSVSKPVTATVVMALVQRGLLDLDRPVNDYLGDARLRARIGDAARATVRRNSSSSRRPSAGGRSSSSCTRRRAGSGRRRTSAGSARRGRRATGGRGRSW